MKHILAIPLFLILLISCGKRENYFMKSWSGIHDRVWLGTEFWSNRLQDWKIQNGRLDCVARNSRLRMRTTHLVNYRLNNTKGDFYGKVEMGANDLSQNEDTASGFLVGAGSSLDVLGASLVQQNPGPGAGIFAGINAIGELFVKDMENDSILSRIKGRPMETYNLFLEIVDENSHYTLTLKSGDIILSLPDIQKARIAGNIALVSHPGSGDLPGSFWFNNLEFWGSKLAETGQSIGPIVGTQYTLSNDILKITAQMVPVGKTDTQEVILEVKKGENWQEISKTKIITPGYTATFKVDNWDSTTDTHYRIKYAYQSSANNQETAFWNGMVKHDPIEKEEIVIAAFTGNHNIAHPGLSRIQGFFNFDSSGIWYPHREIVEHVSVHQPDILFFSGDQIYEGNSPTFPDKENYELDYLYKWFLYCLAYRNLTKDIPTISIPDDHDVYQGNLWGQNGRPIEKDDHGGYVHPAWFVQMAERIQCSNLPDPYDPTPVEQGIGVYYTSLNYGGIGLAILEDRKFKSGCADNPFITTGRPDLVLDPNFIPAKVDLPEKSLLGERQLTFLKNWATDWKNQEMKLALSQTIFAGMATNIGPSLIWIDADLDSNGWPQTGRNKAVDALRKCFAFHLAGDQHLASIVHHGIDEWGDGMFSFCVPSIANFYPRVWWPKSIGKDRPEDAPQNMGKHQDGFGNLVTVYAAANPTQFTKISTGHEPLNLHDKMPGYGIVKMNKQHRSITMECWPRYADPKVDNQYEGWPKKISQFDNYGRKALAYLPTILVEGIQDPVIKISDVNSGEMVYCIRIKGNRLRPKVFRQSTYSITITHPEKNMEKVVKSILPTTDTEEVVIVKF